MPFLMPNQDCQSIKDKLIWPENFLETKMDLFFSYVSLTLLRLVNITN